MIEKIVLKDRDTNQALLPLSGKIMNVLKAKGGKGLESKAIISILAAMGYDPKAPEPLKKLQVGKIVCLADADADGGHINSLLLTLFYKVMPEVFEAGLVYMADMPEFMAQVKGKLVVGNSQSEVKNKLKVLGSPNVLVKHIKGWGEVDSSVLKILAVESTRKLIRIKPITTEDEVLFEKIMANDVESRREALGIKEEQHA
jgi:DNA gyrase subunit B